MENEIELSVNDNFGSRVKSILLCWYIGMSCVMSSFKENLLFQYKVMDRKYSPYFIDSTKFRFLCGLQVEEWDPLGPLSHFFIPCPFDVK